VSYLKGESSRNREKDLFSKILFIAYKDDYVKCLKVLFSIYENERNHTLKSKTKV
jgi:hypothetical protein